MEVREGGYSVTKYVPSFLGSRGWDRKKGSNGGRPTFPPSFVPPFDPSIAPLPPSFVRPPLPLRKELIGV